MAYHLTPTEDYSKLFFLLDGEAAERHGIIGYLRADYGKDGFDFYISWFDSQPHLKTRDFRRELDDVINTLRIDGSENPFANRKTLERYCAEYPGNDLFIRGYGYMIRTEDYSYYFRCKPGPGDYDIYCFLYDNRYLLPELEGQHELPKYCFSVLPTTGEMIRIVRGESGYYPCNSGGLSPENIRIKVDVKNQMRLITRAQEEAMLAGSMFGWNVPGAKPWKYDMNGNLRPLPPIKDELVR